jgi:hypothetical protein
VNLFSTGKVVKGREMIAIVLGTRPEIIKMSPVVRECEKRGLDYFILHTGQHYSYEMDRIFFEELELPQPKYNLDVGSGTHAEQTGKILVGVEKVLMKERPDVVLVQGDTNTVLAGALAATKLHIKVGHVEAGLRSYDRRMPEEIISTKTYTSQVALMTLLAYALAGKYEEGIKKLKGLYMDIYNLTSRSMREHLKKLAEILVDKEHIYLIGRGLQYATALEAALKIKEVSYIHAEAFAGGELKHGPLALIEDGTPVIVFVAKDNEKKVLSNANEVKARGGFIIGVSAERHDIFDYWIKVPECGDLNPIVQIIPIQILAYELAVLKGLDPDRPRNLAKSVTVI